MIEKLVTWLAILDVISYLTSCDKIKLKFKARMLVLYFLCSIVLSLANAQDYGYSDSNETRSYDNSSSCIRKYRGLQSYVLNNEDLMDNLTEHFFKTGSTLTSFVRITYNFKVLPPAAGNYINSTNNANDDELLCVDDQKMFIWSSSALYLLGPGPLFWQTLFAVHIQETSITINLPCLCNDTYGDLLSRLTYLVSGSYSDVWLNSYLVYLSTQYHNLSIHRS